MACTDGFPDERSEHDVTGQAKVIAFANQKGGVAKTTTTLNLAAAFAEEGHRVLCIDMDPQGNLTMSMKIGRERSLDKALREITEDYDFICIDTPPSLGLLTINALTAADKVIVP